MEYRLMIVDGETSLRQTMAETLPWKNWGFAICALCESGQQALEQMDAACPDVVLSNIRMPIADGETLMQWLHENRPRIHVVILSCYRDFEHMNLAIKNQVTDYLLKPVDPAAVREVFENLHTRMDAERREDQDIRQSVSLHFEQWLRDLARGTATREDTLRFRDAAEQRGIRLHNCCLAAIHPDGREGEEEQSRRHFQEEVQRIWKQAELPVNFYCLISGEGQMGAVFSAPGNSLDREKITQAVRILQQLVKQELSDTVSIGLSRHVTAPDQLPEAWQNALYCTRQSLLLGNGTMMFYEDIELAASGEVPCFSPELIEGCLLDGDYEAMEAEVSRVFAGFGEGPVPEYRIIDHQILSLLFTVDLWALRYDIHMGEILRSLGTSYEDIRICDTLMKKRDFLCAVLFAVQLQMKKQRTRSRKGASLTYQVRELIEREFDNSEMSLDYIATRLKKHPSYISKIFKKELGCNFNDYLNRLRIEKAEQLLLLPENKIYEIARACGYVDTSHFNRVFRKYKGVSPSEYREEGARQMDPGQNLQRKEQI